MSVTVVPSNSNHVIPGEHGDGSIFVSNQTPVPIVVDISLVGHMERPFLARGPEWREICADMIRAGRDVEAFRMLGQKSKAMSEYVSALDELYDLMVKSSSMVASSVIDGAVDQMQAIADVQLAMLRIERLREARLAKQARIADPRRNTTKLRGKGTP